MTTGAFSLAVGEISDRVRNDGLRKIKEWHSRSDRVYKRVAKDNAQRFYRKVDETTVIESRGFCGGIRRSA